jgi:hypothetical protein
MCGLLTMEGGADPAPAKIRAVVELVTEFECGFPSLVRSGDRTRQAELKWTTLDAFRTAVRNTPLTSRFLEL